jgi:hypothetical protein
VHFFGDLAGDPKKACYSYDLGGWHIIALNSEGIQVGGCGTESEQGKWLEKDLAIHPTTCTLAYFHKPLFSSGQAHAMIRRLNHSGKFCITVVQMSSSTVMITTMSGSRYKTLTVRLILSTGFGSSWSVQAARTRTTDSLNET